MHLGTWALGMEGELCSSVRLLERLPSGTCISDPSGKAHTDRYANAIPDKRLDSKGISTSSVIHQEPRDRS